METVEKTGRTAERLAKTNADTYKLVVDHFAAQQERGVRFAQEVLDGTAREVRHQAESNRSLTQELVERADLVTEMRKVKHAYDEGIAAKVEPKAWDEAMGLLVAGVKARKPAEGFENAIARCGDILAEHFPADASDNPNELSDAVVVLP